MTPTTPAADPAAGTITPAHRLRRIPRRALVLGSTAVAAGGVVLGLWASGTFAPGYPHAWCGAVETTLRTPSPGGQFSTFMTALQSEQAKGAPLAKLIADENKASQDAAAASAGTAAVNSSDLDSLQGNIAQAYGDDQDALDDIHTVEADAGTINLACGKPAGWETGQVLTP